MSFWLKSGQDTLHRILAEQKNENRAKNVIIFIGDGMGLSTITSGRIYVGQRNGHSGEEYQLSFEKFPNAALAKVDIQIIVDCAFNLDGAVSRGATILGNPVTLSHLIPHLW